MHLGYNWMRGIADLKRKGTCNSIPNPMIAERLLTRIELSFHSDGIFHCSMIETAFLGIGRAKTTKRRDPIPEELQIHDSNFENAHLGQLDTRAPRLPEQQNSTLDHYNIEKESTLHLVIRLGSQDSLQPKKVALQIIPPNYEASVQISIMIKAQFSY
jgi:hypothetical protein